jgi:type I restriction enzyme M protein
MVSPWNIAVFDSVQRFGDPKHLLFMIECKQPTEKGGVPQCENYLSREPHAILGIWANNPDLSAPAVFSYRLKNGNLLNKRKLVGDMPRPGEPISSHAQRLVYADLRTPTTTTLRRTFEDLLDRIVGRDSKSTRREDQLDQLCNIFLLKLEQR